MSKRKAEYQEIYDIDSSEQSEDEPDLPTLKCQCCRNISSIGGTDFMRETYGRMWRFTIIMCNCA